MRNRGADDWCTLSKNSVGDEGAPLLWRWGGVGGCVERLNPEWVENRRSVASQEEETGCTIQMFWWSCRGALAGEVFAPTSRFPPPVIVGIRVIVCNRLLGTEALSQSIWVRGHRPGSAQPRGKLWRERTSKHERCDLLLHFLTFRSSGSPS